MKRLFLATIWLALGLTRAWADGAVFHPEAAASPAPMAPLSVPTASLLSFDPLADESAAAGAPLSAAALVPGVLPEPGSAPSETLEASTARLDALFSHGPAALADEPFDISKSQLQSGEKSAFLLSGYRFVGNRVVAAGTARAVTQGEFAIFKTNQRRSRHFSVLPRLNFINRRGPTDDPVKKALFEQNRDVLSRHAREAWRKGEKTSWKGGAEEFTRAIFRSWARLVLRQEEKTTELQLKKSAEPLAARLKIQPHYYSESERRLGMALAAGVMRALAKNPEGAKLLEGFVDEKHMTWLPAFLILDIDPSYGAFYSSVHHSVVMSLSGLRARMVRAAPEAARTSLSAELATEAKLADYAAAHPEAVDQFVAAEKVNLFHELEHAAQNRERDFFAESGRGNLPPVLALEMEHEAYYRQNLFLHAEMEQDPAAVFSANNMQLGKYLRFLADIDQWRAETEGNYRTGWPGSFWNVNDLKDLQEERLSLWRALSRPTPAGRARLDLRLQGARAGDAALARESEHFQNWLAEARSAFASGSRRNLLRFVDGAQKAERLDMAFYAWRYIRAGSQDFEKAEIDQSMTAAADLALTWLAGPRGKEQNLWSRYNLANAICEYFTSTRRRWTGAAWEANLLVTPEAIAFYRDMSARQEGAAKHASLKSARELETTLERNKAELRRRIEDDLAAARAEKNAARRENLLSWARQEAAALGDAVLIEKVKKTR